MPLSPSMSWLAIGLGLFVLWQIVKRLPWDRASVSPWSALSEDEWNEKYDEAVQWRDWQTCDYLIEERDDSDWFKRAGERGQAGAPFDWDEAA